MESSKKSTGIRYLYLVIGVLCLFAAGIIYAWSIVKVPITEEFGWLASKVNINYTIMLSCFCIGGMIPGLVSKYLKSWMIIIGGGLLTFFGYLIASQMTGNIVVLYISSGVMGGRGIGCSYNEVLTLVNSWFPEKRGFSGGVLMMSFGISTLVLGNVTKSMYENPAIGWRNTYLIIGSVIGVLMILAGVILRFPGENTELPKPKEGKINNISSVDYTPAQMLKRSSFWRFFLALVLMSTLGSGVISTGNELIQSIGASESFAVIVVGILSISNGVGRVIIGLIFDKFGFINAKRIAGFANVFGGVTLIIAILTSSVPLGIIAFIFAGASYGCCPTLESFMCSAFYGTKYFSINMAIINIHLLFASLTAPLVSGLFEATGGYLVPAIIICCFTCISLGLNLSVKKG